MALCLRLVKDLSSVPWPRTTAPPWDELNKWFLTARTLHTLLYLKILSLFSSKMPQKLLKEYGFSLFKRRLVRCQVKVLKCCGRLLGW